MGDMNFTRSFRKLIEDTEKNLPEGVTVTLTEHRNQLFNDADGEIIIRGGMGNSPMIKFYRDNPHQIISVDVAEEKDYSRYEDDEPKSKLSKLWNWLSTLFDREENEDE